MNDQGGRFVYHKKIIVFVHDIEGNRLGRRLRRLRRWQLDDYFLSVVEDMRRTNSFALHTYQAIFDPAFRLSPACVGHMRGKGAIEALVLLFGGNPEPYGSAGDVIRMVLGQGQINDLWGLGEFGARPLAEKEHREHRDPEHDQGDELGCR